MEDYMSHIIISIIIRVIFWGCILSLIIMAIKSVKKDKIREEKEKENTNKRVYHWVVEYPTPYEQLCNDINDMAASAQTRLINYEYTEKQNKIEKDNVMKKSDLRSGDIIQFRNGDKGIVLLNSNVNGKDLDIIVLLREGHMFTHLRTYNDDLTCCNSEYDIMKVCSNNFSSLNLIKHKLVGGHIDDRYKNIKEWTWEREHKKEMTVAEIEKQLGYEIKIIKE